MFKKDNSKTFCPFSKNLKRSKKSPLPFKKVLIKGMKRIPQKIKPDAHNHQPHVRFHVCVYYVCVLCR